MAAFLGFIVQSLPVVSGEHWFAPYRGYVAGVSPQERRDNVPAIGKLQILVAIGMLESYGEGAGARPRGYGALLQRRPPGIPPIRGPRRFRPGRLQPLRPVQLVRLRLPGQGQGTEPVSCKIDAIDATWPRRLGRAGRPTEQSPHRLVSSQARGRRVEINNGRAAMLGIFMMLSESAVPGRRSPRSTAHQLHRRCVPASRSSTGRRSTSRSSAGPAGWAFLNSFPSYT